MSNSKDSKDVEDIEDHSGLIWTLFYRQALFVSDHSSLWPRDGPTNDYHRLWHPK